MSTYAQATPAKPADYVVLSGNPIKQNSTTEHYKPAVPPVNNALGTGFTTGKPISG